MLGPMEKDAKALSKELVVRGDEASGWRDGSALAVLTEDPGSIPSIHLVPPKHL